MAVKSYSHQSVIAQVHQNRAIFRDQCFIKLPTKDQSSLKDLQIMVLVQFPILTSDLVAVSDEQGNKIDSHSIKAKLGITSKIQLEHMMNHSELLSFKTEFINEIPLYDLVTGSIVRVSSDSKLIMKKFSSKGFNIKMQSPCAKLQDEPGVVFCYGIDVLSIYFTHEKPLNRIITLYDHNQNLSDSDIADILQQTKEISP